MEPNQENVKLRYTIHKFSSYSVNFLPQYVLLELFAIFTSLVQSPDKIPGFQLFYL